jgi:hypothetical protein
VANLLVGAQRTGSDKDQAETATHNGTYVMCAWQKGKDPADRRVLRFVAGAVQHVFKAHWLSSSQRNGVARSFEDTLLNLLPSGTRRYGGIKSTQKPKEARAYGPGLFG